MTSLLTLLEYREGDSLLEADPEPRMRVAPPRGSPAASSDAVAIFGDALNDVRSDPEMTADVVAIVRRRLGYI